MLSLSHSVRCVVIISRFELVEIIMHSSHSVSSFGNDWPAALYRDDCRRFSENHIFGECCLKINRSYRVLIGLWILAMILTIFGHEIGFRIATMYFRQNFQFIKKIHTEKCSKDKT